MRRTLDAIMAAVITANRAADTSGWIPPAAESSTMHNAAHKNSRLVQSTSFFNRRTSRYPIAAPEILIRGSKIETSTAVPACIEKTSVK